MPEPKKGLAKRRYEALTSTRQFFLDEARRSAELTIPALMPRATDIRHQSKTKHEELVKPYQSLGARGVNNLSSKLLLTLLPPTTPFFRYEIDPKAFEEIENPQEEAQVRTQLQQKLSKREKQILKEVEVSGFRSKGYSVMRNLLVTGNMLAYLPPDGGAQLFPLNSYCVKRDGEGNVVELAYVEVLDRDSVPERISELLEDTEAGVGVGNQSAGTGELPGSTEETRKTVELYTLVVRHGDRFTFHQELANGTEVPGTFGDIPVDESPWLVLRYTSIDGEDYGRSFVEEYRGDLAAHETISKALQFGAANAAKLVVLVAPNGT
ncbi:MAG: portal protein, partial [Solirubrobacterales bacterium]